MGVDISVLNFIMDHKDYVKGNTLQIGRQGLHYAGSWADRTGSKAQISNRILSEHNVGFTAEDTVDGGDGHTEKLFMLLGAETVDSIDYSPYERCTIVHDLNKPISNDLVNKFDYILDAGTMEHIFDVKTVTENYKNMLKLNGVIAILTCCNNFVGHGFYQFSPEFFRTVFSEQAGFRIIHTHLYELISDESFEVFEVSPPNEGSRQEFKTSNNSHYIAFVAQKVSEANDNNFQQSDYVSIWGGK